MRPNRRGFAERRRNPGRLLGKIRPRPTTLYFKKSRARPSSISTMPRSGAMIARFCKNAIRIDRSTRIDLSSSPAAGEHRGEGVRFPTEKWISSLHLCAVSLSPLCGRGPGVRGAISDPKNGFHLSTVLVSLPPLETAEKRRAARR